MDTLEFCHTCFSTEVTVIDGTLVCGVCGAHTRLKNGAKFHNEMVVVDGIRFPSKLEAKRYSELKLLESQGLIHNLERQVKYILVPPYIDNEGKKEAPMTYTADFRYLDHGVTVIEDTKGFATRDFLNKWKLLRFHYRHDKTLRFRIVR